MIDEPSTTVLDALPGDDVLARSLPGRLLLAARRWPDRPAVRQKELGIYVEYSWAHYQAIVAAVTFGLARRGVGPGDVVAILSDNRLEWIVADLAAQAAGALACGVYPTNAPQEVAYVLANAGVTVAIVEDQEQLDKVLEVRGELPALEHVVIIDPRGTREYADDLVRWEDLRRDGEQALRADAGHFERCVAALDADAAAVLIYTSGTTSRPKGALWSQAVMTAQADRFAHGLDISTQDTLLSYLPLCHGAEKLMTQLTPLTTGSCVHFGESLTTVQADLVEIGPTLFLGMPRIWEKMRSAVEIGLRRSTRVKRAVYRSCLAIGGRLATSELPLPLGSDRVLRWIIDAVAFRALREHLGLRRAWFVMSVGAPVGPDLLHWLQAIGIPVVEGYGLTEAGVTHLCPVGGPPRIGTVGLPQEGVECRVADDGEILIRSATNFTGYLDDEAATRDTLTDDGWVRSGDLGELDADGYLRIVGRKKQVLITASGKNLSPAAIENAIKASPYISQAVPVGDARPFVTALIEIDGETVGDWASGQRLAYTSFESLASQDEVVGLIQREVDRANEHLARASHVRRFRLLPRQLHQGDGELTATQKVRREVVLERFGDLIDAMYGKD